MRSPYNDWRDDWLWKSKIIISWSLQIGFWYYIVYPYIVQQFPKEIHARRKELVTTLKWLKDEGALAYFVGG